ncbi:MAG: CxxxxCH/CxxCH domain-containing protein, partial [Desulfuromonadales bacterium]|nr:CxxxxCH/CxxCH domain-containing protein [Desulfuromonadales bacterium]
MRVKYFIVLLIVALVLVVPPLAMAANPIHYFDCKDCHRPGYAINQIESNLCLSCHDATGVTVLGTPRGAITTGPGFTTGDASNLYGNNPSPGDQTSHNWAATSTNPEAGASEPVRALYPGFYSRYGSTGGKVACSRCHDPHAQYDTGNDKMLPLKADRSGPMVANDICLACHAIRGQSENHGWMTHPIVSDYNASVLASPEKFNPIPVNTLNADIRLVDGGVSCTSCHGVHFVDSDASTPDGPMEAINKSEGKLLRGDGPGRSEKSSLCQSCHTYEKHGNDTGEKVGCLVCHSGHSYDPEYPNYFVLRKAATTTKYNTVGGLDYSSPDVLDVGLKHTFWNDQNDGTADGFCEKCHGDAKDIGLGAGDYHVASAVCTDCHKHSGMTDASFSADCNGCHAYPPVWGSHEQHINSSKMPELLGCGSCHSTSGHMNDFSEVRFDGTEPWMAGATYSDPDETSRYTRDGGYNSSGLNYVNCDNLYCHSNAAPFDKSNLYRQPIWGGSAVSCSSCHDDGGASTGLSGRHDKHTDAGAYAFSCAKCHSATVADRNTVNNPEQHIDLEKDVSFVSGGTYNSAMICASTYCHSDGDGGVPNVAVAWSDSVTLDCADCHNGRIGDSSQMESNAHLRLANEAWIREYPCEYCHYDTVDLSGNIKSYAKHVNEKKDIAFDPKWKIVGYPDPSYNATTMVCDNLYCHSDGTTEAPEVRDFPWDRNQHAKCDSCHGHETDDNCLACHPDGNPEVSTENQWKMATPMYENTGPGTARANSHLRHLETEFACENCHMDTVVGSCNTVGCHDGE